MKNSIKREQSQACLNFAERENFRPKVRRYKKTILTLVALLAVTGAWAQETPLVTITFDNNGPVYSVEGLVTLTGTNYNTGSSSGVYYWSPNSPTKTLSATVEAVADNVSISKVVFWGLDADYAYPLEDTEKPFVCYSNYDHGGRSLSETDWTNIESSERIAKIDVYAPSSASGPEVAWDKAEKTGSFTMPGGNVTLEPEYYPQAALATAPTAINDVPATTDGAIVEAGTVANIGSTETAQGTVMYYVSQTALDDAALLALAADAWKADVPTAESLAAGQAYVYYYVRGNDSDTDDKIFSDGDILAANALTVTIAAEPTYAVTFAEGTDPNEWSASPNADVKKGQTVTVNYTGSKKVIGVKAEKKAKTPALQTVNIGGDTSATLYYLPGETFGQAIANHPENSSFEIKGGYITCNGLWLSIGYYDGDVTPDTLVEANGDYRGLLA